MKHCDACQIEYADDVTFCSHCGSKLVEVPIKYTCPNCSQVLGESYEQFCPHCGQRLSFAQNSANVESSKSSKKYIAIAIVAVLIGGFFAFKQDLISAGIIPPITTEDQFKYGIKVFEDGKYDEGAKWLTKSAQNGHSEAQFYTFFLYYSPESPLYDRKKAFEFVKPLAEAGDNSNLQLLLGDLYAKGNGVEKNEQKAFEWYLKAAQKGEVGAFYEVAKCYEHGIGVLEDGQKALHYYLESANSGSSVALYKLYTFYKDGKFVEKDYNKALEFLRKSALKDYAKAQYVLGYELYKGTVVEEEPDEAIKWLTKVVEADDKEDIDVGRAYFILGKIFKDKKSFEKAYKYYHESAIAGFVPGMEALSNCYFNGIGIQKNASMGLYWRNRANESRK